MLNVLECGHVVSFEGANAVAALLAKRQLCLKCAEEAKAEASSSEPPDFAWQPVFACRNKA